MSSITGLIRRHTLKMGNGTTGGKHYVNVDSSTKPENFSIFLNGNRMLNKDNSIYDAVTSDNWNGISIKQSITDTYGVTKETLKSDKSFQTIVNGENVSTADTCESAEASYEHVISFAGNGISPDKRTAIDQQCAYETETGTGNMSGTASYDEATDANKENIDKYNIECGVTYEYPQAVLTKEITDADNDGMDDDWELARGLDPTDPSDTNGDYCGQGYTNIEYYINDLTVDSFPEGVVTLSPETSTVVQPTISAFETIEAENFTDQNGIRTEDTSGGGQNIGFIENGDYIMFRRVDFEDGAKSFTARISGNTSGMELYLDKLESTPVASLEFSGTAGFSDYQSINFNIPEISGIHNLYIKFTGGDGYLLNMDSFVFGKNSVALNGNLIKNLNVLDSENSGDWYIDESISKNGIVFGDRDFTFTSIPETLSGAEYIRTACDSKNLNENLAEFTADKDITLYIAIDNRVETLPEWLKDFNKTGMTVSYSNDVTADIYSRNYSSGDKITLGTNGQSTYCVNYTAFVKESENIVIGDVNNDRKFNVSDAVILQKWLINASDELVNWQNADLYKDNKIDVFDLVMMKKLLVSGK